MNNDSGSAWLPEREDVECPPRHRSNTSTPNHLPPAACEAIRPNRPNCKGRKFVCRGTRHDVFFCRHICHDRRIGLATHGSHEITDLLHAWQQGDSAAYDALARLVYAELHRIAAGQLRDERAGHTLNPSALVNEAFVKLCGIRRMEWQDRLHFYRFAARLMRQVLLESVLLSLSLSQSDP